MSDEDEHNEQELADQLKAESEDHPNIYQLDELLSRVTPENIHEEIDFGLAVGLEEW